MQRFRLLPGLLLATLAPFASAPACLLAQSLPATAPTSDVQARVATQNALFEDFWQNQLKNNPELATSVGDYRYNDRLGDASLAQIAREHAEGDAYLRRLQDIATEGMADQDRLSHELLERRLTLADSNYALKNYEMPVNQQNGIHTALADLPLSMPFDSVKHYEDYISRLHEIPRALEQTTEVMRAGEADHLMPVRFLMEKIPVQCEGILHSNPFLLPTKKYPASISAADQQRLTAAITAAVNKEVFPAYRKFADFVRTDYAPHGRTDLSIESLPEGKRRYALAVRQMTTLPVTPAQVHAIGLQEVTRITGEMTDLAHKQGYKDLATWRAAINADPRWKPKSEQQIVDDFAHYIHQMEPRLPDLFTLLPKSPVTVEPIPDFAKAEATHYVAGSTLR